MFGGFIFYTLFFILCFGLLLAILMLPYPYPLVVLGLIALIFLYQIIKIIRDKNLTRSQKWDKLFGL